MDVVMGCCGGSLVVKTLLFQRNLVQFTAPTWQLITVFNSTVSGEIWHPQTNMPAKHVRAQRLEVEGMVKDQYILSSTKPTPKSC